MSEPSGVTEAHPVSKAPAALSNRVQSLRLPAGRAPASASPWSWVLALACAALAVYTAIGGTIPGVPRPLAAVPAVEPEDTTKSETPATETAGNTAGESAETPKVATPTPAANPQQIALEAKGYIIPEQQILVSPQVSGRVIELNFDAGYQVKEGDILAVLDSTEYQADLARAEAQVAAARERVNESQVGNRPDEIRQAQAELGESRALLEQARRTYERRRELFEQKIVTPQDLDDSKSEFDSLAQRVEKLTAMAQLMIDGPRSERKKIAEAELKVAEAELVRSNWRMDNTIIKAPITGTVLKKNAELGNLVNPIAFNGSFSLCDLADLSKLEVELDIQERDIAKVKPNQVCRIRAEAFPDRVYEGYVSRLMPIANRAKGAVPVRVRIAVPASEQGQFLKPEMGANVTFFASTLDPAAINNMKSPEPALQSPTSAQR